jgi:hypothetical protein
LLGPWHALAAIIGEAGTCGILIAAMPQHRDRPSGKPSSRRALALPLACLLGTAGCGSGGDSSSATVPRSAKGVQATLSGFEATLKDRGAKDACQRYFTANAIATIEAIGGKDCATAVTLLRRTGSGFVFTHTSSIKVSGDRATVVSAGTIVPAKLVYADGRWRFEGRSPSSEGG